MTSVPANRYGDGTFGPYVTAFGLSANVDDFTCPGWDGCTEVFLSATAAVSITGFFAVPGRRMLCRHLTNSGQYPITLLAQSGLSLEGNRVAGASITLPPDGSATLVYDYVALRWRVACHTGVTHASRSIRNGVHWFTDFLSGANAVPELNYTSGGGAAASGAAPVGSLGTLQCSTDNATVGSYYSVLSASSIRFSMYSARVALRLQISQLQTAADHAAFRFGFIDTANVAPVDGAYIEYDTSVSANWRLCTANNSARTQLVSGVPVVAATWVHLEIAVNAAGSSVDYFINGNIAGTITTNIPTATIRTTMYGFHVVRLAGTPTQLYGIYVDCLGVDFDYAPAR